MKPWKIRPFWKVASPVFATMFGGVVLGLLLIACVNPAAVPCCQGPGLFELPKVTLTEPEPPKTCKAAVDRESALLAEIEAKIADPLKASIREAVANKSVAETTAEAWDAAATLAYLDLRPDVAAWAELNALKTEWRSDFAVQAGVYLAALPSNDDAKLFLHCAYSAGNRSPFLLEALANVYHDTGDEAKAALYIDAASEIAPDDEAIDAERTLFKTGKSPGPPASGAQDSVDFALSDLRAHIRNVMAFFKRTERLRFRVEEAFFGKALEPQDAGIADRQKGYDETFESLRKMGQEAKMTDAQIAQKFPGMSPAIMRNNNRNMFFYSAITVYLSMTENVLSQGREAEITEGFDVGFWAEPMGLDPIQYARMLRSLHDFKYEDVAINVPGYRWEDWGGAYFLTFFDYAGAKRREGHGNCLEANRGNLEAETACRLEVDKKYCSTVRQLHKEWSIVTEALTKKLALRFDNAAAAMLMDAGFEVSDAYDFAAKYAKEMNVKPGNVQGSALAQQLNKQAQEWVAEMNNRYTSLVDMAVHNGDGGPASAVESHANTYRIYKDNATQSIDGYKSMIEETCQPVDKKVLEQLIEEHKKAVSQMLWERLIKDLNVEWKPTLDCSFSLGDYLSIGIDGDGNRKYSGKWSFISKKFGIKGETPNGLDGAGAGVSGGVGFGKDGKFRGVTATVAGGGGQGAFSGKGSVSFGAQWDSKTNSWTFPTKISATLGIGISKEIKGKKYGIACYPGELRAKFDARLVAKDAMDFLKSTQR